MLLRSGPIPTGTGWSFEVKWDGFRALVSTGRLKLHRGTIYRLISSGVLPAVRIDRALRVSSVELDQWLRSEPEQAA
jgi:excisionase family DNA binding protein